MPFPPGGGTDTISRTLTQKLSESWGQQVIADNRPGSGGTIGMAIAAKLPPDGYNVVLGQLANLAIAPALYPKLQYDPVRDFMPITLMTRPFGWDTLAVRIFELTSEAEWERAAVPGLMLALAGLVPIFHLTRTADRA